MYDPEVAVSGSGVSTSGCAEKMGEDDGIENASCVDDMAWPFREFWEEPDEKRDASQFMVKESWVKRREGERRAQRRR